MKYILAILACAGLFILYAVLGGGRVWMGAWRRSDSNADPIRSNGRSVASHHKEAGRPRTGGNH